MAPETITEEKFMFDRLIESESQHPDLNKRRRYFILSTFLVGSLFLTAVVVSLYAADFDIGSHDLDMTRLMLPVLAEAPEPLLQEEQTSRPETRTASADRVIRTDHIARMEEHQKTPSGISVVQNQFKSRPETDYDIGRFEFDPVGATQGPPAEGRPIGRETRGSEQGTVTRRTDPAERESEPPPPVVKRPPPQSKGVVNGHAIHLPKPPYPRPAQMVGVEGDVQVQVTIDETGKVVSARAISGHPLLRGAAENAARNARFNPTTLSLQPVKVTGVIVYKFKRN